MTVTPQHAAWNRTVGMFINPKVHAVELARVGTGAYECRVRVEQPPYLIKGFGLSPVEAVTSAERIYRGKVAHEK